MSRWLLHWDLVAVHVQRSPEILTIDFYIVNKSKMLSLNSAKVTTEKSIAIFFCSARIRRNGISQKPIRNFHIRNRIRSLILKNHSFFIHSHSF